MKMDSPHGLSKYETLSDYPPSQASLSNNKVFRDKS